MSKVTHEFIDGVWQQVSTPNRPERNNFVIVCQYGDWSGFRTLADCLATQPPFLAPRRPNGFYWIEER